MAVQVRNLVIKQQSGTDNTFYATWDAPVNTVTTTTTSGSVKVGSLVSIKAGATYYNGVSIPSWVMALKWYVHSVSGDRAVLNKDQAGRYAIMSPVNTKYLSGGSSSSSSSTTTENVDNIDHYKVVWKYSTGDGIWFNGTEGDAKDRQAIYNPPANATSIRVYVTPVSETYQVTVNDKTETKSYWTGTAVNVEMSIANTRPTAPSGLTASIEKYTLTASVENISDVRTDQIEFEVYDGNKKVTAGDATCKVTVLTARAIFTYTVAAGGEYRVRCRAVNTTGGTSYSEWTDFVDAGKTIPSAVTNVVCTADSKTSVKITWSENALAESYAVQYTSDSRYFDTTSVPSHPTDTNTAYITGLETGRTWYFRVKAVNAKGDSGWSNIVSIVIGTKPEPPTTWSLSTVVGVGEDMILYWTHNSEDGSKQTEAELCIEVNGTAEYITVTSSVAEDEDEPIYSYTIDTNDYPDGGEILWMVKTKGVANEYSGWSTQRTINIFAPPKITLTPSLDVNNVLSSLPLSFLAVTDPANQSPISYHISVTSDGSYETVDNVGNSTIVTAGSNVYSKVITPSLAAVNEYVARYTGLTIEEVEEALRAAEEQHGKIYAAKYAAESLAEGTGMSKDDIEALFTLRAMYMSISAGDITLVSGQTYTLTVIAAMDSGLTAKASSPFSVSWTTKEYITDASVVVDTTTLSAYISPFCMGEGNVLIEGVTLSVYRREADGTFTEIATGLSNTMVTTVTDPHPSLDYARYRIVAVDSNTGSVDYSDLPGIPVNEPSIVIQWDEQWVNFDYDIMALSDASPWAGSMIRIPYNVDVTENYNPDVSLIEYIGRKNPVSYYGTQRGEGGTWSATIPKSDKATIYALRRLKAWMGDVYVREPSGIGYWARIKVSMSQKHRDVTIPVSFDVTRVEGGK